jgi:hypothetical protein
MMNDERPVAQRVSGLIVHRSSFIVLLLFSLLALLMTWPLARTLGSSVAYPGDPYINSWILDWDYHATFHAPLSLFDANAFYPARDALAFSENLYGIALFLFPLRAAGVTPIAAHNVAMLLGFALSGWVMFLLGREVTGSAGAGVAAGVFYAFVPFRFVHLSHVQHVWGWPLPLMLYALLRHARAPSRRSALLFGAAFLLNGLANIHAFLFGSIALALAAALVRPRAWRSLVVATTAAMLLLLPFLLPYRRASQRYGMERSAEETMHFSATPGDWLVAGGGTRVYKSLVREEVNPERRLFPGALALALACAGLLARGRRALAKAAALAWVSLGFLGSLGLHTFFYRFLFAYVPGFRAIRVPARWAMVAYVGLAILVALGTSLLARQRTWQAALVSLALLVELRVAPIRWWLAVPDAPPVYAWLAQTGPHAVIELPINEADFEYLYLLRATAHHRPIVNGISGFFPPETIRIHDLAHARPITAAFLDELRRLGVDRVVVHGDFPEDATLEWLRRELDGGRLGFLGRFASRSGGGDWVFGTNGGGTRPPELEAFLAKQPTFNDGTFGILQYPQPGEVLPGGAYFSGFAFSPYGIRGVDFLLEDGGVRLPATLFADPGMSKYLPWYDATQHPRFVAGAPRRPPGVRRDTDITVEITDGRGEVTRLEHRWFTWK